MAPPVKKGSKQTGDSSNDLLDALKEYEGQRTTRKKKERRQAKLGKLFGWLAQGPAWLKTGVVVVLVALVGLIGDGVRRESGEFHAGLAQFSGAVTVTQKGKAAGAAPQPNMELGDEDIVRTGADGSATLVFPDGSSIQLEPNTEFEVRLLDYNRGGQRDRSFMVRSGSVIAKVSQFFGAGAGSQATICTPTAVAAVRGTGFRVVYDPKKGATDVQVVEGKVGVRTATYQNPVETQPGQSLSTTGYTVQNPKNLTQRRQQGLTGQVGQLTQQYEKAPGFLDRIEMAINAFFDPFLQIIGLAPGSWSYSTNNAARKAACAAALRRLQAHLAGATGDEVPEYLNPVTLAEIQQDPREVSKILLAFSGGMLESYQKTGKDTYVLRARARNRGHTLYELTEVGVREVKQ